MIEITEVTITLGEKKIVLTKDQYEALKRMFNAPQAPVYVWPTYPAPSYPDYTPWWNPQTTWTTTSANAGEVIE